MNNNGMSSICDDLGDSDEENDEEFGALGSILSWDDADEADQGAAISSNGSRDRDNGVLPTPPELVQFSTKDGNPMFSFLQAGTAAIPNSYVLNSAGQFAGNGNLAIQLPQPTPISSFAPSLDNQSSEQAGVAQQPSASQQHQQQQQHAQQQFVAQSAANFAHLFAQQAGSILQQQTNASRQTQQPQPVPLRPLLQVQPQQQSQQQAQQQQPQPVQLAFSSDPNTFLQQLQFAQFQQQMRTGQTQQQMSQQLQSQFPPPQPAPSLAGIPLAVAPVASVVQSQAQPLRRTTKSTDPQKKASSRAPSKAKAVPNADVALSSMVSASDTDGETTRRVKLKKSQSDARKLKATELSATDLANMSEAEKAKANRDRNREHARNTRLRKKAYLEKLKATVDDLCRERDSIVSERASAANLLVEMHNTRTEVLMSFFALRTANEKRRKLWSSILDESCFTCVTPVTPYRSFPASEVQISKCQRTIMGIDGMMSDTASLHLLLDTLVDRSKRPFDRINFRYTLVTEDAVVAGNQLMARWIMTTTNAVYCGAKMELTKQGMLCCRFNSAHKIVGLEIMFDVLAFMLQLKQAAGTDGFSVVPNTVQTCQRSFDKPMVVTIAEPPYTIIQVNALWTEMTGYSAEEVVSKASCSILQPPGMDRKSLMTLMQEIRQKRPASAALDNTTKNGKAFSNFLTVFPLSTDSRIAYFLGLTMYYKEGTLEDLEKTLEPTAESPDSKPVAIVTTGSSHATQATSAASIGDGEATTGPASASVMPPPAAMNSSSIVSEIPRLGSVLGGLKRPRETPGSNVGTL